MANDCCSGLCGTHFLLVLISTGLVAAGVATDYWYKNGNSHWGLWNGFKIDNNQDPDWLNAVRGVEIVALAMAACLLFTYLCHCCCNKSRRSILGVQFLLLLLAAAGAVAGVVVYGLQIEGNFGWSFYLACAGAALYAIVLLIVIVDICCSKK